ncbi:MAG: DUF1080 domain-containing protein [Acidobacteria bacterium]|nr:DUF1080 domain-containing protein [Acidobacteriota bacterium]
MRILPSLLAPALATVPAYAQTPSAAVDLAAWELVSVPPVTTADAVSRQASIVAVTGTPVSYIASRDSFRNYRLHAEWRWPGKAGNGGVLVHISSGPKDRQWPLCYQIQMKNTAVGDLLPMAGATFGEPLSSPPGAATPLLGRSGPDSERPVGEWNTVDILCRGDTIEVTVNGVVQNRVTHCSLTEGRVGFQLEGTPFELRNVSISSLR